MKTLTVVAMFAAVAFWVAACSDDSGPSGEDAGTDAGTDSGPDAGQDAGHPKDAGADDGDAGYDAGPDEDVLVCGLAELDCDGACTDVSTDPDHCGHCGHACGAGESCVSGLCGGGGVSCPPGSIDCSGECLDVSGDPEDCGGCNLVRCGNRERCHQGQCVCRPGLTDCGGTCVDTGTDPAHCGGCSQPCAEVCTGGICGSADACDLEICDGACVDWVTDPLHCGSCTRVCAVDQVCFAGGCWDYQPAQGCESCAGCGWCEVVEPCCDLPVYGPSCVDSPQPCPY